MKSEARGSKVLKAKHEGSKKKDQRNMKIRIKRVGNVKIKVKQEIKIENGEKSKTENRELPSKASSFAARLPLWIQMCKDFQKDKRTWAPAAPCCLPNTFLDPPQAPDRSEMKACYHRLSKDRKRDFRRWVESPADEQLPKPRSSELIGDLIFKEFKGSMKYFERWEDIRLLFKAG